MIKAVRNFSCNKITKKKGEIITNEEKEIFSNLYNDLLKDGLILDDTEEVKEIKEEEEVVIVEEVVKKVKK